MKKIVLIMSLIAFAFSAISQNCETYIPTTVGTKVTTQHFDKKDKLTSTVTTEIKSVEMIDGKQQVVVETQSVDADGIPSEKTELTYCCNGDVFEVDTKSMLDQGQMGAYESMQIEYTFENLQYPPKMTAGMQLKDGFVEAVVTNEGIKMVTIRVDVKDSKVEAIESITVPAGTYDAAKINQTIVSKTGFITIQMQSIQWMVNGIGAVRTETYNKKGKLVGYSVVSMVE